MRLRLSIVCVVIHFISVFAFGCCAFLGGSCLLAQSDPVAGEQQEKLLDGSKAEKVVRLEQVEVQADYDVQTRLPFLPDVEGTRINVGK